MLSYIKGQITFKNPGFIIVETNGLGYHLNISLHTYATVEKMEQVKILVHEHIKEDSHTLYGFADEEERALFRHLISVSGIGPSTAQVVLSTLNPEEVRSAIIGENVQAFKAVKGIGPKTAKRLILDLKDKLLKESDGAPISIAAADNTLRDEALSALVALGFSKISVQKALNKVIKSQPGIRKVEELIKLALRELS
ncbi:MAG TPA: Holliday junction branch migration protein RuvA [Saprospiraceae bacterium]|nr:Holliday junction branch migration protein RuvA [Saprospiraceae bacterium]